MYLLTGKGQSAPKDHMWAQIFEFIYKSTSFFKLRCSVTDATVTGQQFQLLTSLHAKVLRLLRILTV